jgi:rhodanese-related sulfurtransferase
MLTDGVLMLISKKDFEQFMFQPMVQWISSADAKQLLKEGAIPVDVRRPSADKSTLKKAIQVPLSKLREQIVDLDTKSKYLILCDNKREAAVSSFLFSKHGLDGYILRGENAPKSK